GGGRGAGPVHHHAAAGAPPLPRATRAAPLLLPLLALPAAVVTPAQVLQLLRLQAGPGALGTRQHTLGALGDVQRLVQVRRGGVRLGRVVEVEAERLVDQLPAGDLVPVDQRDRRAHRPGAPGAADAVEVDL